MSRIRLARENEISAKIIHSNNMLADVYEKKCATTLEQLELTS